MEKNRLLIVFFVYALLLSSCIEEKRHTVYYPDMDISVAYETYRPNPLNKNGASAFYPVQGTVTRDVVPYRHSKNDSALMIAAKALKNPYGKEIKTVQEGRNNYQRTCMLCHGETLDGKGHLYLSGKYPNQPANLIDACKKFSEGELFHYITLGSGLMDAMAYMLPSEDRWKIIRFLDYAHDSIIEAAQPAF